MNINEKIKKLEHQNENIILILIGLLVFDIFYCLFSSWILQLNKDFILYGNILFIIIYFILICVSDNNNSKIKRLCNQREIKNKVDEK